MRCKGWISFTIEKNTTSTSVKRHIPLCKCTEQRHIFLYVNTEFKVQIIFIDLQKKYIEAYHHRNPTALKFCELLKTDKKNIVYKFTNIFMKLSCCENH